MLKGGFGLDLIHLFASIYCSMYFISIQCGCSKAQQDPRVRKKENFSESEVDKPDRSFVPSSLASCLVLSCPVTVFGRRHLYPHISQYSYPVHPCVLRPLLSFSLSFFLLVLLLYTCPLHSFDTHLLFFSAS